MLATDIDALDESSLRDERDAVVAALTSGSDRGWAKIPVARWPPPYPENLSADHDAVRVRPLRFPVFYVERWRSFVHEPQTLGPRNDPTGVVIGVRHDQLDRRGATVGATWSVVASAYPDGVDGLLQSALGWLGASREDFAILREPTQLGEPHRELLTIDGTAREFRTFRFKGRLAGAARVGAQLVAVATRETDATVALSSSHPRTLGQLEDTLTSARH